METGRMGQKRVATLKTIIRALKYRNFRLFFVGQSISLIGTWMQRVALGWLVYRLTNSAFLLGIVGFAGQIPILLLAPLAGVVADRWNRHRLLILTQALAMLQAFVLASLVLTHTIKIWQIVALSLFLGIINAFDMPIRQSFMAEMVDKKDLGNAIALNSSMVNGGRLLGPSIAGLLIAGVGEGICFLLNGISFMTVIASLLLMKITNTQMRARNLRIWQEFKEGFNYAFSFEPIRAILLMLALVGVMGMPYTVLMPVFARDILRGGPDVLGFLMGAAGVGALAGALYLASRKSVVGLEKMIPITAGLFGLGLISFSFSHILVFSLALMLITGFGQMVQMASSNTLLQTVLRDDKRGRVMSFYTMAFMGMTPLGSLLAGSLASRIGAQWTVFIGGTACIIGATFFARRLPAIRKSIRPIYANMGILPEIASGIHSTTESSFPNKLNNQ
jgi:MFS family permease